MLNKDSIELLITGCQQLGVNLTPLQQELLLKYVVLLIQWNKAYNLTAIHKAEEIIIHHILDSLSIIPYLKGNQILDIGTGAGLPGIPLAILYPDKSWSLLDSNGKKTRFINQVILELALKQIKIYKMRIEDYNADHLASTIVSRAFTQLDQFIEVSIKHIDNAGILLAMKGKFPEEELTQVAKRFNFIYAIKVIKLEVPYLNAQRHLCIINL